MALIQSALILVVYAVVLVILLAIASIFVFVYQAPKERSIIVSIVCIFTLLSLLATALLLPVDVALVSSTTSSRYGRRKDWATQDAVDNITHTLKIVYYLLYSLDALLCLIVIPFTYFWYEEYDEVDSEEGRQTLGSRLWGAMKYTIGFILFVVILFLIGFFVPRAKDRKGAHYDLDYFQHLLRENRELPRQCIEMSKLTCYSRRRACPDFRNGTPNHDRYYHLYYLYCSRPRSPTGRLHQIRTGHLRSNPEREYGF